MSDPNNYIAQVREGQSIVEEYIQNRSDYMNRIEGMGWGQSSEDKKTGFYVLVLSIANKRHLIKFLEKDLADAPNDMEVRHRFGQQIDEFFGTLKGTAVE